MTTFRVSHLILLLVSLACDAVATEQTSGDATDAAELAVGANIPECGPYRYKGLPRDVTSFCDDRDLGKADQPQALSLFSRMVGQSYAEELTFAFWAFSHEGWGRSICSLITSRTTLIRGAIDKGRNGDRNHSVPDKVMECARQKNAGSLSFSLLGQVGDFLEYHPKYIAALLSGGISVTIASTGNPTRNSEFNIDTTFAVRERGGSRPFYQWHKCAFDAFVDNDGRALTSYPNVAHRYKKCVEPLDLSQVPGIEPYLLPFDRGKLTDRISFLFGSSRQVSVAVQSADSLRFRDLFLYALRSGVELRMVRDDDLFYVESEPSDMRLADDEFMNTDYERNVWLRPLVDAGAQVRYLPTNNLDGRNPAANLLGNFLHSKILIFYRQNKPSVAMVGSANLTDAAFGFNVENVYVISDERIVDQITEAFERIWERSLAGNDMPPGNERPN